MSTGRAVHSSVPAVGLLSLGLLVEGILLYNESTTWNTIAGLIIGPAGLFVISYK